MVIKRIGPLSFAKICGTLYTIVGLLVGCVLSVITLAGGFASSDASGRGFGAMVGAGAIIVLPILYGGLGFVSTFIAAAIYNLVAGIVGGIELDVQ